MVVYKYGAFEFLQNPLRDNRRIQGVSDIGQQYDELITAETGHNIARQLIGLAGDQIVNPNHARQPFGNLA